MIKEGRMVRFKSMHTTDFYSKIPRSKSVSQTLHATPFLLSADRFSAASLLLHASWTSHRKSGASWLISGDILPAGCCCRVVLPPAAFCSRIPLDGDQQTASFLAVDLVRGKHRPWLSFLSIYNTSRSCVQSCSMLFFLFSAVNILFAWVPVAFLIFRRTETTTGHPRHGGRWWWSKSCRHVAVRLGLGT